jgi:hypothetical protein
VRSPVPLRVPPRESTATLLGYSTRYPRQRSRSGRPRRTPRPHSWPVPPAVRSPTRSADSLLAVLQKKQEPLLALPQVAALSPLPEWQRELTHQSARRVPYRPVLTQAGPPVQQAQQPVSAGMLVTGNNRSGLPTEFLPTTVQAQ